MKKMILAIIASVMMITATTQNVVAMERPKHSATCQNLNKDSLATTQDHAQNMASRKATAQQIESFRNLGLAGLAIIGLWLATAGAQYYLTKS